MRDHVRDKVGTKVRKVQARIEKAQDKAQQKIDKVRERMEEPLVVRFRDKISFVMGVLGCLTIEFIALCQPELFPFALIGFGGPLLVLRYYIYFSLGWQFFLIDFCYMVNALCLLQILVFPSSYTLFLLNFLHASGPLALAIPTWRCSLVFHSLDKFTSVVIHYLPALFVFIFRWYPPSYLGARGDTVLPETLDFTSSWLLGLAGYIGWQLSQSFVFEVACAGYIKRNPQLNFSLKWLTTPPYSGITATTFSACQRLGIMAPGELFDGSGAKTKLTFVTVQLLYTAAALTLPPLLWSSFRCHLAFLVVLLVITTWNGASFYIEVFSKSYQKQFAGDLVTRRAAAFESMGVPTGKSAAGGEAAAGGKAKPGKME